MHFPRLDLCSSSSSSASSSSSPPCFSPSTRAETKHHVARRWRGRRTRGLNWGLSVIGILGVAAIFCMPIEDGVMETQLETPQRHLLQSAPDTPAPTNGTNGSDEGSEGDIYPPSLFSDYSIIRGGFLLYLLGILYMFLALAIACDDYFVPALEVIIDKLNLSEDVAGATFMAAGGSAPELFTSLLGEFVAKSNIGFGTIVGSAVFNVMFVIGACAFATRSIAPDGLPLTWWPLFRDSTFYAIDLGLLTYFFSDKIIKWWESAILFAMYIVYVIFMSQSEKIYEKIEGHKHIRHDHHGGDRDAPKGTQSFAKLSTFYENEMKVPLKQEKFSQEHNIEHVGGVNILTEPDSSLEGSFDRDQNHVNLLLGGSPKGVSPLAKTEQSSESDEESEEGEPWDPCPLPEGGWEKFKYGVLFPINFSLWLTVPNCAREEKKKYFAPSFFMCIVWIAFFTYFMVWWAESLGKAISIPSEVMGYTLLAAGTSVPDLITSVLVARQGKGDMAVSSSIGSNIFDVTFGLPIPWLIRAFTDELKEKTVESKSLGASVAMLILMLFLIIVSIALMGWKLDVKLGILCLFLYCVFVSISLLLEYEVIEMF